MAELSRDRRVIISLSVHILRASVARSGEARVDGVEVRLAPRCLLPHCAEHWPLELFWDSPSRENEIGCAQGDRRAQRDHPAAAAW